MRLIKKKAQWQIPLSPTRSMRKPSPTPTEPRLRCQFIDVYHLSEQLAWLLNNGKGLFSKIYKPTKRDGSYHLQFDFPKLF